MCYNINVSAEKINYRLLIISTKLFYYK